MNMLDSIFALIAIFGAVIASITDLKGGVIPNRLSFSLLAIGIGGHFAYNLYGIINGTMSDYSLFLLCLKNVALIFVIGYLFWMLGGWSAGDVKEFLFLAALVPQYPLLLHRYFNPVLPVYPFALTILVNTFLSIFPFIFVYSIYASFTRRGIERFLEPLYSAGGYVKDSIIIAASVAIVTALDLPKIFILILIVILFRMGRKAGLMLSALFLLTFALTGSGGIAAKLGFLIKLFIGIFLFLLIFELFWNSLKVLRKEALQEEIKITSLEEGMVIAEEIYRDDGRVIRDDRDLFEKLKDAMDKKSLDGLKKKPLIVNTTAAGASIEEIDALKRLVEDGEMEDRVRIKRSMPFAPVILLGLIVSLIFGDLALYISMWL